MSEIKFVDAFDNKPYDIIVKNKDDTRSYIQRHMRSEETAIDEAKQYAKFFDYSAVVYTLTNETIWESGDIEQSRRIKISEPIETFQSCNACNRYNKRGSGPEQMYKSLCRNIRGYVIGGMCVRLCEDCARELRDQLNELLEADDDKC